MSLINRCGTFRGLLIDWGISQTQNGYPQFQISLVAKEYWDQDEKVWVDWSQYEENEIIAYLVLVGGEGKPLLNCHQLQKALEWSGESFKELAEGDYGQTTIQFRVEESTYENVTRKKVVWIDHVDAEPGRTVQKLDVDEVKKLDAMYATALCDLSGGNKPKKPVEKPKIPETTKAIIQPPLPVEEQLEKPKKSKNKSQTETVKSQPPAKKETTKQEAWEAVIEAKAKTVTDDQLSQIWLETIEELGGEDNFEAGDWERLKNIVVEQVKDDIPFSE